MASLHIDPRTKHWLVRFYHEGRRYQHSCCTASKARAIRVQASIEEILEDLHNGRRVVPETVDPREWIVSGGKCTVRPNSRSEPLCFGELCDRYYEDQGRKAESTLHSERTHIRHLKRLLHASTKAAAIGLEDLRRYVKRRLSETYRGKPITKAVRYELATFRHWIWAQDREYLTVPCPLLRPTGRWRITLPKPAERMKFQTWEQIERRIARGGLDDEEIAEQWRSLFLDEDQIAELLDHVKSVAAFPSIYPMFVFAAYTGARRSELMNSLIEDFDFDAGQVMIRERKRRKDLSRSFRYVPLHPRLAVVMQGWFALHPGGQQTLVMPASVRRRRSLDAPPSLSRNSSTHHFKQTLKNSKWQVVRGFHVLRHSFGSNLVRTGQVPSEIVGRWMGHTTEEMREHYQHLFPQDGVHQIGVLR